MADIRVTILNFEEYKGRKDVTHNSWFRCSNRLLEDPDFYDFSAEEMLVWVYLLSIASQKNSECITISYPHAQSVARLKEKDVNSAIKKLKNIKVISSSTLRRRNAHGTFTCATNKQDITNKQDKTIHAVDESPDVPLLIEIWNEHSGALQKVKKPNPERYKKAELIYKENTHDEWVEIVKKAASSSFCTGLNDNGWRATFDWLIGEKKKIPNYLKVQEGNYDDRKSKKEIPLAEYFNRIGDANA